MSNNPKAIALAASGLAASGLVKLKDDTSGFDSDEAPEVDGLPPVHQWATNGNQFWGAPPVCRTLEGGVYKTGFNQQVGVLLEKSPLTHDKLIHLPDTAGELVIEEIRKFWTLKPKFQERGLTFKRGVMMYGPPGSGKTATLAMMLDDIVCLHGGVGIVLTAANIAAMALKMARGLENLTVR